jgi:hypothetical protein
MLEAFSPKRFSGYLESIKPLFHLSWWFIMVEEDEDSPISPFTEYVNDFTVKYNMAVSLFAKGVETLSLAVSNLLDWFLGKTHSLPPSPKGEDPIESYVEKQKRRWMRLYDPATAETCSVNRNIDALFYKKKEFLEYMKQENTDLERTWKTRILLENTPRGNIIMYYDAYKQGFAYYSDQVMSYPILNAVAMKYVVLYGCRDFFLDNQYTETNSPLLEIYEKDTPAKPAVAPTRPSLEQKNKVFVKLKNYNTVSSKTKDTSAASSSNEKVIWKNRFVSYGKMANYSILQKNKKTSMVLKKVDLAENIDKHEKEITGQGQIMKEFVNYRQFKEMNLLRK